MPDLIGLWSKRRNAGILIEKAIQAGLLFAAVRPSVSLERASGSTFPGLIFPDCIVRFGRLPRSVTIQTKGRWVHSSWLHRKDGCTVHTCLGTCPPPQLLGVCGWAGMILLSWDIYLFDRHNMLFVVINYLCNPWILSEISDWRIV